MGVLDTVFNGTNVLSFNSTRFGIATDIRTSLEFLQNGIGLPTSIVRIAAFQRLIVGPFDRLL